MTLSREGFELRNSLAEAGVETTPDQLEAGLEEAIERIHPGPDGTCVKCHRSKREDGSLLDFRYGWCDDCGVLGQPFRSSEESERAWILQQFESRLEEQRQSIAKQTSTVDEIRRLARYANWLSAWRAPTKGSK